MRHYIYVLLLLNATSCAINGPYKKTDKLKPDTWHQAEYAYTDSSIVVAIQLESWSMVGDGFGLYIENRGNNPIPLNSAYDLLSMKFNGERYVLTRLYPNIMEYPSSIDAGSYVVMDWQPESQFDEKIHLVESFQLTIDRQTYTVDPNDPQTTNR